jgi:hypothetical protein
MLVEHLFSFFWFSDLFFRRSGRTKNPAQRVTSTGAAFSPFLAAGHYRPAPLFPCSFKI